MESKPLKPRQTLHVDLGALKAPWLHYCATNQVKPSDALRQVVEKLVGQSRAVPAIPVQAREVPGQRDADPKHKTTLRLTVSEREKLDAHAAAAGFSAPKWIIALIRGHLTQGPQLGQHELEKLGQSNYQLVALGRHLSQIAKALNTKPEDTSVYRLDLIQGLEQTIQQHVKQVSAVLLGNAERWQLK